MRKIENQMTRARNNKKFGKQLAAYALGVAGATGLASQADAAPVAVTFGFGSSWDPSDQGGNNRRSFTVGPGFGTIGFYQSSYFIAFGGGGYWGTRTSPDPANPLAFVYGDGIYNHGNPDSTVKLLPNGTVVGTGLNGTPGTETASMARLHDRDHAPPHDLGADVLGFNFGFMTETGHFGWANADWIQATQELIINAAFVESVAGDPITIGAAEPEGVPEPSTIGLLSIGAAGLVGLRLLRRRSKQAADKAS